MTNDEIRAIKTAAVKFHAEASMTGNSSNHICALLACVEALLARQAEVIKLAYPPRYGDLVELGGKLEAATDRLDKIRAILDPQPSALAKEKKNG